MTDSQLTPHFKYSTVQCCQKSHIFSIDRPTVQKNDQHVHGWKITNLFFGNCKNQKKRKSENWIKIDI